MKTQLFFGVEIGCQVRAVGVGACGVCAGVPWWLGDATRSGRHRRLEPSFRGFRSRDCRENRYKKLLSHESWAQRGRRVWVAGFN